MFVYDYFWDRSNASDLDLMLHNAGFSASTPNYSYGYDTRDYYLIEYVVSGKGTYTVDNHTYYLSKNDGFVVLPGSTIKIQANMKDPWTLYWVGFSGKKAKYFLDEAKINNKNLIFHLPEDNVLDTYIENIYNKMRIQNSPEATLLGYLYQILGVITQLNCINTNTIVPLNQFQKVVAYINMNIRTPLKVTDIAQWLDINASQLYRIFKQKTGLSPQQYIAKAKIEKACELIEKTDLSSIQISNYLGFEYPSHFYKVFKKCMGIRPSEYDKLNLKSDKS